jgi:hypothetical protein
MNKTAKTPKEDLMNDALKHYEEAGNAIFHHRSDIPMAIIAYYSTSKESRFSKFKNSYFRLIFISIISLVAGFSLMLFPEKTADWLIRGVGFVWVLEGISFGLDIWLKYLKGKLHHIT